MIQRTQADFQRALDQFKAEPTRQAQFYTDIKNDIIALWIAAYLLGVRTREPDRIYLTPDEEKSVKKLTDRQLAFFAAFFAMLIAGAGEDPDWAISRRAEWRMGTYANPSIASFNQALVDTAPAGATIDWLLGEPKTDHCTRCPELAAGGPYTKETLVQVPGDGQTPCLFSCYCQLRFR